ncbi:GntR family transcriptional regulator [Roseibium sp.]
MQQSGALDKNSIYETLRKRICLLDYVPGTSLNERLLADEFSVSRTPMRAVLQRLEYDGLISSQHGRGTIVTSIDLEQMRGIYALRIKLTEAIADAPARIISDEVRAELEHLEGDIKSLLEMPAEGASLLGKSEKRAFGEISIRIHEVLQSLTDNETLRDFSDVLFYQSARYWFLLLSHFDWKSETREMLDEVRLLKNCILLGDIQAAALSRKLHLALVLSRIAHIESFPEIAEE